MHEGKHVSEEGGHGSLLCRLSGLGIALGVLVGASLLIAAAIVLTEPGALERYAPNNTASTVAEGEDEVGGASAGESGLHGAYEERPGAEELPEEARNLQSYKRAEMLGYDWEAAADPDGMRAAIRKRASEACPQLPEDEPVEFDGPLASELNYVLSRGSSPNVLVVSEALYCDEPVTIPSGCSLEFDGTELLSEDAQPVAILIDEADRVRVSGGVIDDEAFAYGIYVCDSHGFSLEGVGVNGASRHGIVVCGESSGFSISGCSVRSCGGGLFLNGEVSDGVVEECSLSYNRGAKNVDAGIALGSFRFEEGITDEVVFWEPELYEIEASPHDILIEGNELVGNTAQGISSHAGYMNCIASNKVVANRKEGMCLDFASLGNCVWDNEVAYNGERQGVDDGYPESNKLPGISLDNAGRNVVACNSVSGNSGSGIKMVRACWDNLVWNNSISSNSAGSARGGHYFGVELASDLKPDRPDAAGLDFAADFANSVTGNAISGDTHYSAVYIGEGCSGNVVESEGIESGKEYSMEDHSRSDNLFDAGGFPSPVYDNGIARK